MCVCVCVLCELVFVCENAPVCVCVFVRLVVCRVCLCE